MKTNKNIVSVVVFDKVKPKYQTEFEDWQNRIISEIEKLKGFVSVSSKKLDAIENEYFTIFQFDSNENLQIWLDSETQKKYLQEVELYTLSSPKVSFHQGLEFFFAKNESIIKQPPFYKKVLMGIAAVYPLIIIVGKLFHWIIPGFEKIPFELALFFEVIVISSLMNYPVMPTLTKWLHRWLYK
jgi:antibiotic biosynthesis monooxygenase (ABM) superfamily enzyme